MWSLGFCTDVYQFEDLYTLSHCLFLSFRFRPESRDSVLILQLVRHTCEQMPIVSSTIVCSTLVRHAITHVRPNAPASDIHDCAASRSVRSAPIIPTDIKHKDKHPALVSHSAAIHFQQSASARVFLMENGDQQRITNAGLESTRTKQSLPVHSVQPESICCIGQAT